LQLYDHRWSIIGNAILIAVLAVCAAFLHCIEPEPAQLMALAKP
jgi:hypothetical protein